MTVTPSAASVKAGATVQLSASSPGSKWSSSNPSVATVSGSGLVKGVSAGSATITAKKGNQKATATVTVEAEAPVPEPPLPPPPPPPPEPEPTPDPPPPPPPPPPTTGVVYVSDLPFVSESNGWGPVERDKSNAENVPGDGRPLNIAGKAFTKGLGVHAPSDVVVKVPAGMRSFLATIGVDEEVGNNGRVTFEVWVDGSRKYQSAELTGADGGTAVAVDVTNANQVSLRVLGGSDIHYDHADWADARFSPDAAQTPPPTEPPPTPTPEPTPVPPPSTEDCGPQSGIVCDGGVVVPPPPSSGSGSAREFNGRSDRIVYRNIPEFHGRATLMIAFVYMPLDYNDGGWYPRIISQENSAGSSGFAITMGEKNPENQTNSFRNGDANQSACDTGHTHFTLSQYHHVVVKWDGNAPHYNEHEDHRIKTWKNGVQINPPGFYGSNTMPKTLGSVSDPFCLGNGGGAAGSWWHGRLAKYVAIWLDGDESRIAGLASGKLPSAFPSNLWVDIDISTGVDRMGHAGPPNIIGTTLVAGV